MYSIVVDIDVYPDNPSRDFTGQLVRFCSSASWSEFCSAVTVVHSWLESLLPHAYKQLLQVHDFIYETNNSQLLMKANCVLPQ